jgi:hypothetical protein
MECIKRRDTREDSAKVQMVENERLVGRAMNFISRSDYKRCARKRIKVI